MVAKKINYAVQQAQERMGSLNFQALMSEGKQGQFRHQCKMTIDAMDKDEVKKNLPEVLVFKQEFRLFLITEAISPELIGDTPTAKIANVIQQVNKKHKIPPQPLKVYICRIASDHQPLAHTNEGKCFQYVVVIFPYMTSHHAPFVSPEQEWDVQLTVFNCLAPMPWVHKLEIWDTHFLDGMFTPLLTSSADVSSILLVCNVADKFVTDAVETMMDLEDEEAKALHEYATIFQMTSKILQPMTMLTDSFYDTATEVLNFFQPQQDGQEGAPPSIRFTKVVVALSNNAKVHDALTDMTLALTNRSILEAPLGKVTAFLMSIEPCSASAKAKTKDEEKEQATVTKELLQQCTTSLGCMQSLHASLGKTFTAIDDQVKGATVDLIKSVCRQAKSSSPPETIVLSAASQLIAECCLLWPFDEIFVESQSTVATAIRALSASKNTTELIEFLDNPETGNINLDILSAFLQKLSPVDIGKLESSISVKFAWPLLNVFSAATVSSNILEAQYIVITRNTRLMRHNGFQQANWHSCLTSYHYQYVVHSDSMYARLQVHLYAYFRMWRTRVCVCACR